MNKLSWSKTRDEIFGVCPRKYYFQYYGSWGGWNVKAPARTRKIYVLKQLQTRHIWAGNVVHRCIERALVNLRRGIRPMEEEEAVQTTLALMRQDYASSKRGDFWRNTKSCGLFEHAYDLDIPRQVWKETADHVANCLHTFYRSDVFQMIRGLEKKQWLEVEEFASFQLDGVKIHVVLDFSCREKDGILIYDWKTGRSDTQRHELQVACYSFYACNKWQVNAEQVRIVAFNLHSNQEHAHTLKDSDLESVRMYILGSIRDMKLLLDDPSANTATEARFDYTENKQACETCYFKQICPRWETEGA